MDGDQHGMRDFSLRTQKQLHLFIGSRSIPTLVICSSQPHTTDRYLDLTPTLQEQFFGLGQFSDRLARIILQQKLTSMDQVQKSILEARIPRPNGFFYGIDPAIDKAYILL